MNLVLRAGTARDAEACGSICYEAFKAIAEQHGFPPDFPARDAAVELASQLLSRKDVYSVVAEVDGRIAGSNFLWENSIIASIGPTTVDPGVQNAEIGKRLMEDVMQRAFSRTFVGIRLVQAAYHNRSLSLYSKLGFNVREPLLTLQGPALGLEVPAHAVRLAKEEDLDACNKLCAGIHGHDRGRELLDAVKSGTATVVEHEAKITGYATMIGFHGHAAAESNQDLKALIGAARDFPGPGFLVPTRNSDLLRWCLKHGLRAVQPMTLMSMGLYNEPAGAFLPSIRY